jgi:hypothetical protein
MAEDTEFRYPSFESSSFEIMECGGNVVSLLYSGYSYFGGAHGMPYWDGYNIDLGRGKQLEFEDFFPPGADWETLLLNEMLRLIEAEPAEYEDLWNPPESLETADFYIKDGNMVIFFHPYELSFYARGFVEFAIPLERLEAIR